MHKSKILILDETGYPYRWASFKSTVNYYVKGQVQFVLGTQTFTIWGGRSREKIELGLADPRSFVEINSIISVKGKPFKKLYSNFSSLISNNVLFQRDDYICGYCGYKFPKKYLSKDHIIPISRGGLDEWTNTVTACIKCNNEKGDKLPSEHNMVLKITPYMPNKVEYLLLRNNNILEDQLEFLNTYSGKKGKKSND